jgi:hypothetical protein
MFDPSNSGLSQSDEQGGTQGTDNRNHEWRAKSPFATAHLAAEVFYRLFLYLLSNAV